MTRPDAPYRAPDFEMFAALQADVLDDQAADVARLKAALFECVMARAHFEKRPDGTWRREGGLLGAFHLMTPMSAEDAQAMLASHGIPMHYREVPSPTSEGGAA